MAKKLTEASIKCFIQELNSKGYVIDATPYHLICKYDHDVYVRTKEFGHAMISSIGKPRNQSSVYDPVYVITFDKPEK